MRSFLLALALFSLLASGPAAAATRISDPAGFLRQVYGHFIADQTAADPAKDYNPPEDIYSPALQAAWDQEQKESGDDLGRLDFYFWVNAQDWELKSLKIAERTVWKRPDRRVVGVSFDNFGQPSHLEFYFQKIDGRWLIDDVASLPVTAGEEGPSAWTLSLILKYAREAD
jgi:hypothetical protein